MLLRYFRHFGAILCLAGMAAPVFAASFPDTVGTGYETAFTELSERGIIEQGRPYAPLNRAEALKIVLSLESGTKQRIEWYRKNMPVVALFSDVPLSAWFAPYVEVGYEKGIAKGYPNGRFLPERLLSVEEAVTLLMRSTGDTSQAGAAETSPVIENREGQWYTSAVNAAIRKNIVPAGERLRLGTAITRGQFLSMAHRLLVTKEKRIARYDDGADNPQPVAFVSVGANGLPSVRVPQPITSMPVINAPQPIGVPAATVGSTTVAQGHQYGSEQYFAITIPSANITDLSVMHPTDPFTKDGVLAPLRSGVGHLFSYPGTGGKIMIYGHSSSYPWDVSPYTKIFRQINTLKAGDRIYLTYSGTLYVYEVTFEEAVDSADTSRFQDNGSGEELILYTCWPPDSISQRYLVHAIPVGTVALR